MLKSIIRLLSFFSKEVNEIRRQPRLVLSLMLGPFLILLLFGLGYQGGIPKFRVALVVPPNSIPQGNLEELKRTIQTNFTLVSADWSEEDAMQKLRQGEVDVVEVFPRNILERMPQGQQSPVVFHYAEINPLNEAWVQYLGYAQVSEMNRSILMQAIAQLQKDSGILTNIPPQAVVSPLTPQYENIRGKSLSFTTFYAPSVIALILQHIAITLGALSLVRERLRGTTELFRIAPVSIVSILVGKYLGYLVFLGIIGAMLTWLLLVLGTPFLGSVLFYALMILLLLVASLGIGFLISALSKSDSQAVQFSMLTLLLSIFFSGFFLPLENFRPEMKAIAYLIPLTHGIIGYRDIMLKGQLPELITWLMPGVIAALTFVLVTIVMRRQLRYT